MSRAAASALDARRLVRADHVEAAHLRHVGDAFARHERLEVIVRLRRIARDEGGGDLVIAGLHGHADVAESILDRVHGHDLEVVEVAQVLLTAKLGLEHLRAVDR